VIGKVCRRGRQAGGLLRYLYGPGRHHEHTDPHLVGGHLPPGVLEPPRTPGGGYDITALAAELMRPHHLLRYGHELPVWHCALRAAPRDRMLSDAEWAAIVRDVMHRTGLSPRGQDDQACPWVAVRHAPDHVHLVVVLARQDGRKAHPRNDFRRIGEACRAAEARYGLTATAPRDRTAAKRPTRAETEKAARTNAAPSRITLRQAVQHAADSTTGLGAFCGHLDNAGVLVRLRYSSTTPGQVTGYAVAVPGDVTPAGEPVWYSGGRLAADLTLPQLQARWHPAPQDRQAPRWAAADPAQLAVDAARQATRALRNAADGQADDIGHAAASLFRAAAHASGDSRIAKAAAVYDRASRTPYARIPAPAPAGTGLRFAARMLYAAKALSGKDDDTTILDAALLAVRLMQLAEAIAAARLARNRVHQARTPRRAATGADAVMVRQAMQSFPGPPVTTMAQPAATRPASPRPPPPARRRAR
jgi:hypothetical protein